MSYINSTLFFEPCVTKTKSGDKRIMFKARSKSGGAKGELFPVDLGNLTAREERTLMKYFKKIMFSASIHIKRRTSARRKNTWLRKRK